jgi:signal transduction histidine kinase
MLVIVPVPCQPVEIARGITKILGPEMTGKGIEYSLELGSRYHELVNWVEVDPQRVAQILINLVNNAIKFTRLCPTRNITISVDASDTIPDLGELQEKNDNSLASPNSIYLIYAVQDSGLGIAYEEAKKLFQRFQQGFRTSITYGGSGLVSWLLVACSKPLLTSILRCLLRVCTFARR